MRVQALDGSWRLRRAGDGGGWRQAQVPGTVYTDLLQNGAMEDPFWKDNEEKALTLMEEDYEYELTFACDPGFLDAQRVILRFRGIDTSAEVWLNGVLLGRPENMHRTWEYEVKQLLTDSDNQLRVLLHSPNQYIREAFRRCRTLGNDDTLEGFVHMRKAHYMFGWDWGAHLPDAGIFRPVELLAADDGRIDGVCITQEHKREHDMTVRSPKEDGTVEVTLHLRVCAEDAAGKKMTVMSEMCAGNCSPDREQGENNGNSGYSYQVKLTAPDGTETLYENAPADIRVAAPKLWWPNGYGEQNLYRAEVTLLKDGQPVDVWSKRIGLRTLTVRREKDRWGESFAHEVNGVPIFAMGADYIPEDHLLGRVTPDTTRRLLETAVWSHFNVIRVWGGGYYPDDWFYDACDELGLIVWQDFMFACAVYELTPAFEANIRQEFIDNVKRIRHHACLGLWCGNNEMEQFVFERNSWLTKPSEVRDYFLMFERIIPEILREYDPQTFYWPASPSSGGCLDEPNDPDRGDVHYWAVWHGNRPFSEYRRYYFRYASEFGFQAFPARRTVETFTDEERDLNPFSYIMEKHQRQYSANGKIMGYLQQTYRYPGDFNTFIYASQLLQADAIRYGVEHFRRHRGRCMGAIYWQLNDCWPVISWSSVDYCGRYKALQYYARRFFAPLMISCEEQGMMSAEANMNREHFEFEKSIRLNISNETRQEQRGTVIWQLRDAGARVLREEAREVAVPPLSSLWLDKVELPEADLFGEYVSYGLYQEGKQISGGTVNFSYPKYFRYEDPELTLRLEGNAVVVNARAYAKSVEIQNENEDLILSDNYFDLNAEERRIEILSGKPSGLRVRSVYDI